jgi:hypothetical protein
MVNMVNEPDMTTVQLSKETVAFMKSEGRREESLADISERLFAELRTLREGKAAKVDDRSSLDEDLKGN